MDVFPVNSDPQSSPDHLPSLDASRSWIDVKQLVFRVIFHHENMAVPADEDIRSMGGEHGFHIQRIMARRASDMGHQHLQPLTIEELGARMFVADILAVAIAIDSDEGFEGRNLSGETHSASEIPGMPDDVDRLQKFLELVGKDPVSVRYYADVHGFRVL